MGIYPKSILLTDCRSLFEHVYAMTGKTAEILLPDIHELREATMPWRCALSENYRENYVELWWCSTNTQLADNFTKVATPSRNDFIRICTDNQVWIGKDFLRPRSTQRAHSFGTFQLYYIYYDILIEIFHENSAKCTCQDLTCQLGIGHTVCETEQNPLPQLRTEWAELFASAQSS
jgi:hypothetical protein